MATTQALKRREHELSSDKRAGRFPRALARRRQRELLRRHWPRLVGLAAGLMGMFVVASLFADSDLQRGMLLGFGAATAGGVTAHLVIVMSGTAPTMMGEAAEQWTAQELRVLLGHGWKLVNHVSLDRAGDIDHVLVGPGGVYVLETKWSADPWKVLRPNAKTNQTLHALQRRAEQVGRWEEVRKHGAPHVTPVLVLWGRAGDELDDKPGGIRVHGHDAVVVAGRDLGQWATRRGRAGLSDAAVAAIWESLDRRASYLDDREDPTPRGAMELAGLILASVVAGLCSFVLSGTVLESSSALWLLATAALIAAGVVLRRTEQLRTVGTSVIVGAVATVAVWPVVWLAAL